jgi:hypothetical protein
MKGKQQERKERDKEKDTKQPTYKRRGMWSVRILGRTTKHILGRNPISYIQHQLDLGITKREIPRKLLLVISISNHYVQVLFKRPKLKILVKYKNAGGTFFGQPFKNVSNLSLHHGDLLKIGEHVFRVIRAIAVVAAPSQPATGQDKTASYHSNSTISSKSGLPHPLHLHT